MPVYPLKKGYQVRFQSEGVIIKKNFPQLDKKQAELKEAELKVALAMGDLRKSGEDNFLVFARVALSDWARDHWTRPDDVERFLSAFAYFGQKRFRDINALHVEAFKMHLSRQETIRKRKRSQATVNRYLAVLSRVFRLAILQKITRDNPVEAVERFKESAGVVRYLSENEYNRLLAELKYAPDYLRTVVILALNTALRWSNLIQLQREEINFSASTIELDTTKSGYALTIPLNDTARTTLDNWINTQHIKRGFLFLNPRTKRPYTSFRRSLASLLTKAGIDDFTFHCFRHDCLTQLVDGGANLRTVAAIAGHKRIETTMRYAHAKDERAVEALRTLDTRSVIPTSKVLPFKERAQS